MNEGQADQGHEPPGRIEDYTELADGFRRLAELSPDDPGRRELRDQLVTSCRPLAYSVAGRFRDRGHRQEDLRRVAVVGLTDAIDGYRPDAGSDFLAYAVPVVMGAIRRYFRDTSRAPRAPRALMELVGSATSELAERLNRAPTARELAEHLHVNVEDVFEGVVAASAYPAVPLAEPGRPDDAVPPATGPATADEAVPRMDSQDAMGRPWDLLPERDRQIVLLRFYGQLSQSRIAQRLGLSPMQVSHHLASALARLRELTEEPLPAPGAAMRRGLLARSATSDKVGAVEHAAAQCPADDPVGDNSDQSPISGGQSTQLQEATVAETGRQPAQPDQIDEVPSPAPATMQLTSEEFSVAAEFVEPAFTVLRVSGEVDMVAVPELTEHVQQHFRAGGANQTLVFDLTGVTFFASAGLAVLAEAASLAGELGATIRVVAPSRAVTRPLEVSGLDRVLPVYVDLTSAIENE